MQDQLDKPYADVEHIFRRLGEAAVARWTDLPVKVRRLLLRETLFNDSSSASKLSGGQFERFIASRISGKANDNRRLQHLPDASN